jgi:hypothetical protein
MRQILALLAIALLAYSSTGCRHIAGACDCEHAMNPSYRVGTLGPKSCGCGGGAPAPAVIDAGR